MSTTYGYGITTTAPGVDAKVYVVTLGVHRRDGGALSARELAAIEAALAPLATADAAGKPAKKTTAKAGATRRKGPIKAKAKPPSKPAAKGRKASKAPARKAARRPAEG